MKTLKEKNEVLAEALSSIHIITASFCRTAAAGASEEEKYDRGKTAFYEITKVIANVIGRELFGDAPPMTGFAKFLSLPELGIQFRRYTSANMTKFIATWRDDSNRRRLAQLRLAGARDERRAQRLPAPHEEPP